MNVSGAIGASSELNAVWGVGSTGLQRRKGGRRKTKEPFGMQSGGLSYNHRACQLIIKNHIS